uniref:HTH La-type RNA-binding domain-containing protein n=1 Tax=Strongyloides papillosus TaxID=174720 RepID=A0A0N5B7E7_STREA
MDAQKEFQSAINNNKTTNIKNQEKKSGQDNRTGGNNNINKNKNNNYNYKSNNNKTQNKIKYQNNKPSPKNGIKNVEGPRKKPHTEVIPSKPLNRGGFPSQPDGLIDRIEFYQTPTLNLEIAYFNPDVVRSGIFGPHNPHLKPGQVNTKAIQDYQRKFNKPPPPHVYTGNFIPIEPVTILPHPNLMFNNFNCHPLQGGPPPPQPQNMCKQLPPPRYGVMPKYGGNDILPVKNNHSMNRNSTYNQNTYSKNMNRNRNGYNNNYDGNKGKQQLIPQQRKGGNYNNKRVSNTNITMSNQFNNMSIVENNENKEKRNQNCMVKVNEKEIIDDGALKEQIKKQIEYYFSEDNLIKDLYIRQLMKDSGEKGFVMIEDILNFNKIKILTKSFPNPHETLIEVLKDSKKLVLSNDKLKIRPGTSVLDQLNNLSFI